MNLTISGHHLELTPAIREYVQNKLERIRRHFDHVIDIAVILTVDKLPEKELFIFQDVVPGPLEADQKAAAGKRGLSAQDFAFRTMQMQPNKRTKGGDVRIVYSPMDSVRIAQQNPEKQVVFFAVGFENLTSGMGTAAFVALLMALCDHRFTATQYALLSAFATFGRVYVGPVAGYVTSPEHLGLSWTAFYLLAFAVALPGLAVLAWKRPQVEALDHR